MERVRVVNEDAELQKILEKNYNLLPGDQIDPDEPRRWILIKREMPVPDPGTATNRFSLDFLFADQDATPTLVECKRFADMRARREIVGQMIEYAANGQYYWDKDILRTFADQTARNQGQSLEEAIRNLQGADFDSAEGFFSDVQQNLQQGNIRMIFFLDESPKELRSMVDFLSKQMVRAEVLLVEARQYRLNGTLIVLPKLFGYTEQARKVIQEEMQSKAAEADGQRRKWDKDSFFADAKARLGDKAEALQNLYDRLVKEEFGIKWGNGKVAGSFGPYAWDPYRSRTFISVYSSGWLTLNLGSFPDLCCTKLKALWADELEWIIPAGQKYPTYYVDIWSNGVDLLVAGLVRILDELRAPESKDEASAECLTT